ncbi:MAG: hypothetical protein ACXWVS_10795 [Hyphomicrobium sp.]
MIMNIEAIYSPPFGKSDHAAHHLREAAQHLCLLADLVERNEHDHRRAVPLFANESEAQARTRAIRSEPGKGSPVWIYVLDRADKAADCMVPAYGKISAGCGPNLNEDFADCGWPIVIKVKPGVREADFLQHLRDLTDVVEANSDPDDVYGDRQADDGELPF